MPEPIVLQQIETWKPVVGHNGYEVSSLGRIKNASGHVLSPQLNRGGYHWVKLHAEGKRRTVYLHAAVAEAFIRPRPNGMEVNHLDGDHLNNQPSNLKWVTHAKNIRHAKRVLRRGLGGDKSRKLSPSDVQEIRRLFRCGQNSTQLAKRYSVSLPTITRIRNGQTWS